MREEYDFSDAVRHPLAGKFKGKYSVTIHYDFTERIDISDDEETNKSFVDTKKDSSSVISG